MKRLVPSVLLWCTAVVLIGCGSSEPLPSRPDASSAAPEAERADGPRRLSAAPPALEHEPDEAPLTSPAPTGRPDFDAPDERMEPVPEAPVDEPAGHEATPPDEEPQVTRAIGTALRKGFTPGVLATLAGHDAQVGMIVVYEVDADSSQPSDADMRALFTALQRRLNRRWPPSGRVRQRDDGRMEVRIFRDDPEAMQRIAELLPRPGTLEFRILANQRDHPSLIRRAEAEPDRDQLRDDDGDLLAWWVPVDETTREDFAEREVVKRTRDERGGAVLEVLVVNDPFDVTGAYVHHARDGSDDFGKPCVWFSFSREGGRLFGRLTGNNLPEPTGFTRQLGIILDGRLYSAPHIQNTIFGGGMIHGRFTQEEVQDLVDLLRVGALPIPIRQVERRIVQVETEPAP